ncbi:MAG TPA: TonB-dependent receptor plug domain-containing protein [Opitutaceae bacterium]|jgi:iron complex outermembrane receptor protein
MQRALLCAFALVGASVASAQTSAPAQTAPASNGPSAAPADSAAATAATNDDVVKLPAFEITEEKDNNYVGTSALSSTRIAVDLSELPQSVKVLNNSFLEAVNPTMMSDMLNYVGGGQNGNLNWTPGRMNIRGFTGDADYIDGFSPTEGSAVDSIIYDRFEVIKGPNAVFLAADGSPGGIVNKITLSPSADPSTTLSLQTGRFEGNHAGLDTTGYITADKKLLYRIVAGETYYNGYQHNVYMHRFTVMPELTYIFNENTKLELKAEVVEANWPSYNGLPIDPRTLKMINVPYWTSQDEDAPYNWRHDDVHRLWGTFNSRLTNWLALSVRAMDAWDRADRVESIASPWNEGTRTWAAPATVGPLTYGSAANPTFAMPRSVTADDAHVEYADLQTDLNFNYSNKYFSELLLVGAEDRDSPGRTETYSGHDSTSAFYPYPGLNPNPTPTVVTSSVPSAYVETQSLLQRIYLMETAKFFDDRLILTWGADRAKSYGSNFNYLTGAQSSFIPYTIYKNLVQWGAVIKVLPGVSLFTGFNQNFAANGVGVYNGVANTPLPPKLGVQHEVGLKTDFLNHSVQIDVSYFDIKQLNNTVPSFPLDPANPNVLIPGVISRGFDGDISWKITRNFYLMGSFANYSAKSILGPAVNGAAGSTFLQPGTGQIAYGSIPVDNTAEHTESAYGLYHWTNGALKGLEIGLGINTQGKRAVTDGPNQVFFGYVPGRTLVDMSINYQFTKHIKYNVTIDNLLNEKYIYAVRSENIQIPGTPTNIRFEVEYTF